MNAKLQAVMSRPRDKIVQLARCKKGICILQKCIVANVTDFTKLISQKLDLELRLTCIEFDLPQCTL